MIKYSLIVLAIVIGLVIAPFWSGSTGYVLVRAAGYTIETSLVVAVLLLVLVVVVIWFIATLVKRLLHSKLWTKRWLKVRRERKAIKNLRASLDAWLNRDYQASAELADKSKFDHPDPQLAYALAAAAYGEAGANDDQRRLLTEARIAGFESESLEVLRLLNTNDAAEALSLAEGLSSRKKLTPALWRAIAEQLARFEHWATLRDLLPRIEQQQALPPIRLHKLKRLCFQALFRAELSLAGFEQKWKSLSKAERRNPAIRIAYIEVLVMKGHHAVAAKVTERGLKRGELNIHEIIALSPELWAKDESLHTWVGQKVKADPDNVDALTLYAATRFIDQEYELAEQALREALLIQPEQYTYRLLGETLLAANKPEGALQAFRKASGQR
ncbi:heme biosynthesis HemY N-terminal domain-containing protein [Aliidiomarina quisquiliarum]|uniref:heme biosynthesis HemY N-terminal domain-containing protein n=1 Tax=Aliidiomarina quisquiliarum TaxID=2938947 RepID=UPI00208EC955|nr:heme biosynthesis HemY N-terminal domain-containing protein [Aliidiomarina quisquiliarum]MCO4322500.1 hypothetical protein [Aliidiomarina quisquiliarum]